MKNYLKKTLAVALAASMAMSMAAVGASAAPGYTGTVVVDRITSSKADNLSSFSGGGWTTEDDDYAYASALYINGGEIDERSVTEAITAGTYTATEADGVVIKSTYEGFNNIIVHDSEYAIKNADISIDSDGDGLVTNDFSGFGAAIAAYGDSTVLTIEDSKVNVSGVANLTLFVDDGSDVVVKNSVLHSEGGTLYADYKNSPNQATMVAPPWILGIMGGSRCTNLMGNNSSMSVVDSTTTAAQWAILSTDSGQNMTLTVVNSYMGLTGADYPLQADGSFSTEWGDNGADANPYTDKAGYGTYTIGNSNQKFYGVDMVVGTYANIYTGGIGLYTDMKAGQTIELLSAEGEVVDTYTPTVDKVTTINSDTFGFMAHQGSNSLTIENGTIVNSEYTTFIQKTGCSIDVLVESSELNPGNGILVQVLDNDDSTTGMDVSTFSFYSTHTEYEGWPTKGASSSGNASTYTFSDMELVGDIFNGSGWELNSSGAQTATELAIVLENGTTLEGQISSTAAIHVTKEGSDAVKAAAAGEKASDGWTEYQNTSFPIGHYFDIGQVANKVQSSGLNSVDVTIDETSSWNVTADGIVRNLTAASASIVADKEVTLTVEGTLTLDGAVVTETTKVGNVNYVIEAKNVESEATDVSGWVLGEVYAGQGETVSGANAVNYEGAAGTCRVIDGDASGDVSTGDAIVQYETYIMYGWVAADGTLTTTYPLASEGGMPGGDMGGMPGGDMGGMPGGDMGGMPGGDMGGMPGGDMGGMPGGDSGSSSESTLPAQLVVTLEDGVVTNVSYPEDSEKPDQPVDPDKPDQPVDPDKPVEPDDPGSSIAFTDVTAGAYYYDAVQWAVANSVTTGATATTFAPDAACTRGQVVTFLWRAAGSPEPTSANNPFTDVKAGDYYYNAVLWAVENGITTGATATTFAPDAACTRGQVVTFLWRANGKAESAAANSFTDVTEGAYYYDAVLWAVENGITTGATATTFAPDATCTRGQVVTFLYRADSYEPQPDGSELPIITHGSFRDDAAAPRYASVQNESGAVDINDSTSWHNGVIYDEAGEWTLSGSIVMDTDADGSDTNDFSGLGAAVMVNGTGVVTTIEDATIETAGVAKLALFTDNGAISIVKNSSMSADGGVIYDGYMSTADQSVMVSPPWVLGLGGNAEAPCNARTTNLMGDYSVAAYVDSYFYAKGWGALSVDSGTNMNMVIVNTDTVVETSGYGAYNIGNSTEDYYGSTMDVSTYAIIMTGGEATFESYTGGQVIDVVQFSGETNEYGHGINGTVVAQVSSEEVAEGETVVSKIVSDNFGFMCHNNGSSGWNVVNILDGTEVYTSDAIFLVKKVNAVFNVDNAVLESDNMTILQIIDNDDDYVGLDFTATWGEDNGFGHKFGSHMPTFNSTFTEAEGYSNKWIASTAAAAKEDYDTASNWVVEYNMTNTTVQGKLWNSTGYVGSNVATTLNVNLGEGAHLTGTISAGAFSHTTKNATVGNGDWTGSDALGHVSNIPNSNGVNIVNVTLEDGAYWLVTGICYIDSLTVDETSTIKYADGAQLYVGGELYGDGGPLIPPTGDEGDQPTPPEGDMPTPPEGGEGMPEMPDGMEGGGNGNGDPASMATFEVNADGTVSVTLSGPEMDTYDVNGTAAVGGQTVVVTPVNGAVVVACTAQGGPNMGLSYTFTV